MRKCYSFTLSLNMKLFIESFNVYFMHYVVTTHAVLLLHWYSGAR